MRIPHLLSHQPLPPPESAWGASDPLPGLLAIGGELDTARLVEAYSHGIFPWFGPAEPTLWWSPDPRMVLRPEALRLHRSLRKTLQRFRASAGCEIRIDHDFAAVMKACSSTPRPRQSGTWIVPRMQKAYTALHRAGHAHSIETWIGGELAGGLYCVNIGRSVFGESMFAHRTDASKIALAALVAFCLRQGVPMIDCQQNTAHLASLGAREIPREDFLRTVRAERAKPSPAWRFDPGLWQELPGMEESDR
jgi:leucyl/phenylalanyl-tRNA--protein transferase